jgi:hypothetical protein
MHMLRPAKRLYLEKLGPLSLILPERSGIHCCVHFILYVKLKNKPSVPEVEAIINERFCIWKGIHACKAFKIL